MTTITELRGRLQRKIGDSGGIYIKDAHVIDWANAGVREILRDSNFGADNVTTYTLSLGATNLNISGEILKIHAIYIPGVTTLEETTLKNLLDAYNGTVDLTQRGIPRFYWRDYTDNGTDSKISFWPLPDKAYSLAVSATILPARFTAAGDLVENVLPPMFVEDLLTYVTAEAHAFEKDFRAAEYHQAKFQRNRDYRFDEANKSTDSSLQIVADPYDNV